jgi:hypothetical protein
VASTPCTTGLRLPRVRFRVCKGLESRHLESRAKAAARLDLEVSAGWANPLSRGLWGGRRSAAIRPAANRNLGRAWFGR